LIAQIREERSRVTDEDVAEAHELYKAGEITLPQMTRILRRWRREGEGRE
jgi:hypothetical protein